MTLFFKQLRLSGFVSASIQGFSPIRKISSILGAGIVCAVVSFNPSVVSAQLINSSGDINQRQAGYKNKHETDSEFDNAPKAFALYWQDANEDYQDTIFGELIYNEPSITTKLEMLRLLSKETPSLTVFIHALSMGLSVDEMLLASLEYEPEKARELARAAVTLLPLLTEANRERYSTYNVGALTRYIDGRFESENKGYVEEGDEHRPYLVQEVVDKFFDDRLVLTPYPDWIDGQFHIMASAKELLKLQGVKEDQRWYHSKSSKYIDDRPIFISLYEHNGRVLIDGAKRIEAALEKNPNAQLPVVFIYNRLNERSIDDLGYPATLQGILDAYKEKNLMVTPAPQWQAGEYHSYIELDEFYQLFNLPEEDDFEPEAWAALLAETENYDLNDTSIIVTVLPSSGAAIKTREHNLKDASVNDYLGSNEYAAWDNPRTENKYKYTAPKDDGIKPGLNATLSRGMIVNRPDLLVSLKALGVSRVPVSVYYLDGARVKPYTRGARSLIQSALGLDTPKNVPPGGGVLPPPVDLPPASPPGLP